MRYFPTSPALPFPLALNRIDMPSTFHLTVHLFVICRGAPKTHTIRHGRVGLGRVGSRHRCVVREDGKGEVVIAGLEEKEAMDADGLEAFIADGNRNRTTHATESNDQSSR